METILDGDNGIEGTDSYRRLDKIRDELIEQEEYQGGHGVGFWQMMELQKNCGDQIRDIPKSRDGMIPLTWDEENVLLYYPGLNLDGDEDYVIMSREELARECRLDYETDTIIVESFDEENTLGDVLVYTEIEVPQRVADAYWLAYERLSRDENPDRLIASLGTLDKLVGDYARCEDSKELEEISLTYRENGQGTLFSDFAQQLADEMDRAADVTLITEAEEQLRVNAQNFCRCCEIAEAEGGILCDDDEPERTFLGIRAELLSESDLELRLFSADFGRWRSGVLLQEAAEARWPDKEPSTLGPSKLEFPGMWQDGAFDAREVARVAGQLASPRVRGNVGSSVVALGLSEDGTGITLKVDTLSDGRIVPREGQQEEKISLKGAIEVVNGFKCGLPNSGIFDLDYHSFMEQGVNEEDVGKVTAALVMREVNPEHLSGGVISYNAIVESLNKSAKESLERIFEKVPKEDVPSQFRKFAETLGVEQNAGQKVHSDSHNLKERKPEEKRKSTGRGIG